MKSAWNLDIENGIAMLVFDYPGEKINKFTPEVMDELEDIIGKLKDVKALVIKSGKPDMFIAGADLKQFEDILKQPEKVQEVLEKGHRVFRKLEKLPFPTIAVIDGICLGGGTELTLACSHRIVTDNSKTSIGLPEVLLGIIPGWGGTQRLPRLIGLQEGLKVILGGKRLNGKRAFKTGFADIILPHEFLDDQLPAAILQCIRGKSKKKSSSWMNWALENNPLGRSAVFSQARKNIEKKTKGHYPSPLVALKLIQETYTMSLEKGLKREIEVFLDNCLTSFANARHIIRVFFGKERLDKQETPQAKKINSVGILGAGVMGSGIAWLASYRGLDVRVKDINWEAVSSGLREIKGIYKQIKKIKRLPSDAINLMEHRISWDIDYSGFNKQDLVIEAATEDLNLKIRLFHDLEERLQPDALIASNTSSLTIEEMSKEMKYPERFVGMHFFNPVNRMPLVEVVSGPKTSKEALDTIVKACLEWKKTPIVIKDCHGFLVNRIFAVQANEVMHMLEEGSSMNLLGQAVENFGWPMDPFMLADTVGIDVSQKVFKEFEEAYGKRMEVPKILKLMAERGLKGKKSGKGFYIHGGDKTTPNPEVKEILQSIGQKNAEDSEEGIINRIIAAMLGEAGRCLEEGIVQKDSDLDMALVLGTGFPPFRGGLLAYVNDFGVSKIIDIMRRLEDKHGSRFTPCDLLVSMARDNKKFDV